MSGHMNRRQWIKTSVAASAWLWANLEFATCKQEMSLSRVSLEDDFVRLDNNENPYGVAPEAHQAIMASLQAGHRYPHRKYSTLIKMIAEKENLAPENIILGAGSTEIMTMAIAAFGQKGEVLTSEPTYFDFIFYAEQANCSLRKNPADENLKIDLEAMRKQITPATSLIYLCNPNNPTGAIIPSQDLRTFCLEASTKALVLIDEAYHEYVTDGAYASMVSLVREGKKVLVTRTFSKIYGLAGLRVGYGMSHPEIVEALKKVQTNFASISYPGLLAAIAAYNDNEFTRRVKERTEVTKSYLEKELKSLGYHPLPSQANFMLFRVSRDAKEMAADLEKQKILVRPFAFRGQNWLRVSIGTLDEIRRFLSALAGLR